VKWAKIIFELLTRHKPEICVDTVYAGCMISNYSRKLYLNSRTPDVGKR